MWVYITYMDCLGKHKAIEAIDIGCVSPFPRPTSSVKRVSEQFLSNSRLELVTGSQGHCVTESSGTGN